MNKSKLGVPIVVIGIIIMLVCFIIFLIGNNEVSAASEALRSQMGSIGYIQYRSMFYLPGERMSGNAVVGMVIGLCITVWGGATVYQAKKDVSKKSQTPDLLASHMDEEKSK